MRLDMIFGSDSDEGKVQPGIARFSGEHHDVEVSVDYASADNTSKKLHRILIELCGDPDEERDPHVLISGAGMSNVLTGVAKIYGQPNDLNIGVPIGGGAWGGLSSLLSTGDKPPLNPVLTVPLNGSYTALNLARKFLLNPSWRGVTVVDTANSGAHKSLTEELSKYEIRFKVVRPEGVQPSELTLTPVSLTENIDYLKQIDEVLREGSGMQVAVPLQVNLGVIAQAMGYLRVMEEPLEATGYVNVDGFRNAAVVTAQIMRNAGALENIAAARHLKFEGDGEKVGLAHHKGYTFLGSERHEGSYIMGRGE